MASEVIVLDQGDTAIEGFVTKSHQDAEGHRVIDEFQLTGISLTESGLRKLLDAGVSIRGHKGKADGE